MFQVCELSDSPQDETSRPFSNTSTSGIAVASSFMRGREAAAIFNEDPDIAAASGAENPDIAAASGAEDPDIAAASGADMSDALAIRGI